MLEQIRDFLKEASQYYTGWRPALGWVGVLGSFVAFAVYPIADLVDAVAENQPIRPYPVDQLMILVAYALGTGILRHVDKRAGVGTINTKPYEEAGGEATAKAEDIAESVAPTEDEGAPWNKKS